MMKNYQLETRTYTREEFADIIGTTAKDKNFKRKAETFLQNCGYTYNKNMRKGVEIISKPETADAKLAEILYRFYDIDIQLDTTAFGCFLCAMLKDYDGFAEMPWKERSVLLHDWYDINVDELTLKRWGSKLIKKGLIIKSDSDRTFWKTNYDKTQEPVEANDTERQAYWKEFWEMTKNGETDISRKLWDKYGCCYYSCRKFECSAWDENEREIVETIYQLVEEINDNVDNDYEIKVINSTEYVEVPKAKEIAETAISHPFVLSSGFVVSNRDDVFEF